VVGGAFWPRASARRCGRGARSAVGVSAAGIAVQRTQPEGALFFVTFLPQSLSAGSGSPRAEALLLSGIFGLLYLAWFGLYVAAANRLGRWLQRPRVTARVEQVTGLVLATAAVRLITASH
jgi:threonine/homoserine/homoserine lactone efflux protein